MKRKKMKFKTIPDLETLVDFVVSKYKYPVEPLIYTPEEWKSAEGINSAFIRLVSSKGIVLYEKE